MSNKCISLWNILHLSAYTYIPLLFKIEDIFICFLYVQSAESYCGHLGVFSYSV